MQVLPTHESLQTYAYCCGKTVCGSCDFQHSMIKAIDENDKRAQKKQPQAPRTCEFCRTKLPESDEEILDRLRKRVELKDPEALFEMALYYRDGDSGLSVDQVKCIELLRESASLGFPAAHYQLGIYHYNGRMGLEQNDEEALELYKEAVEGGHVQARHNLGYAEDGSGDDVAAMRHWRLSGPAQQNPSTHVWQVPLLAYATGRAEQNIAKYLRQTERSTGRRRRGRGRRNLRIPLDPNFQQTAERIHLLFGRAVEDAPDGRQSAYMH